MQVIITANKDKEPDNTPPKGIVTGVLEDSDELQAIIAMGWDKITQIQQQKTKINNDNRL